MAEGRRRRDKTVRDKDEFRLGLFGSDLTTPQKSRVSGLIKSGP